MQQRHGSGIYIANQLSPQRPEFITDFCPDPHNLFNGGVKGAWPGQHCPMLQKSFAMVHFPAIKGRLHNIV